MDETMNTGVEVTTEESNQEVEIKKTSGPSKGFVALVVGGIAAVAVGATVAIKRHKKKKAASVEENIEVEIPEDEEKTDTVSNGKSK